MKKYQGKSGTVHAGKITDITPIEKEMIVDGGRVGSGTDEWRRQNNPQIGDWYVQPENGAPRIMSASDFKDEFEQVADGTIPTAQDRADNRSERDKRANAAADREVPREQQAADDLRKAQEEKAEKDRQDADEREVRRQRALSTPQGVQAQENAKHELDQLERQSGRRPT
jgi:hypothetical protein